MQWYLHVSGGGGYLLAETFIQASINLVLPFKNIYIYRYFISYLSHPTLEV